MTNSTARKAARPCKDCVAEERAANRPAPHPGPRCASHHKAKRRIRQKAAHDKRAQSVYGLPPGGYERLYEQQGRRCAICWRATGRTRRLSVDHDHSCCPGPVSCGQCVRGLLCSPCNVYVGRLGDDPNAFLRGYAYLQPRVALVSP